MLLYRQKSHVGACVLVHISPDYPSLQSRTDDGAEQTPSTVVGVSAVNLVLNPHHPVGHVVAAHIEKFVCPP